MDSLSRARRSPLVLLLTLSVLVPSAPARAADPDYTEAGEVFRSGQELLREGRNKKAIKRFKRAHELSQDDLVMGHLALAYERVGSFSKAVEALIIYRRAVPKKERAVIDKLIETFRAEASSKGQVPPGASGSTPDDSQDGALEPRKRFWTWVAVGSSAALAVAGLVVGVSAASSHGSLEAGCAPHCPADEADSVRARAIAADVLLASAFVSGVAAAVLYALEGRVSPKKTAPAKKAAWRINLMTPTGGLGLRAALRF